ncbi:MAG: hypothetical protein K0Q54_747 [Methylobacterium brachiatum]|jgi:hypothetical protein|nr:hypothetical protein [Methylobacterium brachiatum]
MERCCNVIAMARSAPVVTRSARVKLAALTDEEIERMGASDPDHLSLDDAFWEQATQV